MRGVIEVNELQYWFIPGKGTSDALFMVRMLQKMYYRKTEVV